jgi:flagellar basal body-associated protein FliL
VDVQWLLANYTLPSRRSGSCTVSNTTLKNGDATAVVTRLRVGVFRFHLEARILDYHGFVHGEFSDFMVLAVQPAAAAVAAMSSIRSVQNADDDRGDGVPWWVVLILIAALCLLIPALIYAAYKLKSKKSTDVPVAEGVPAEAVPVATVAVPAINVAEVSTPVKGVVKLDVDRSKHDSDDADLPEWAGYAVAACSSSAAAVTPAHAKQMEKVDSEEEGVTAQAHLLQAGTPSNVLLTDGM